MKGRYVFWLTVTIITIVYFTYPILNPFLTKYPMFIWSVPSGVFLAWTMILVFHKNEVWSERISEVSWLYKLHPLFWIVKGINQMNLILDKVFTIGKIKDYD